MTTHIIVFNPGQSSRPIDEAGHVVEPHGWGVSTEEFAADSIRQGHLLRKKPEEIDDEHGSAEAIMVKKEVARLNGPTSIKKKPSTADTSTASDKGVEK